MNFTSSNYKTGLLVQLKCFNFTLYGLIPLQFNVSFLDEAIRGINFFSAQVELFPYHEWPKATSDLK